MSHLVAPAPFGGLEAVVAALAGGMARRGHDVRILALLGASGGCAAFEEIAPLGVELVELRHPPRDYRAEARAVRTEIARRGTTVLHTHGYHADLVGLWASGAPGSRLVSTAHGFTGGGWKNRLYEWVDRRVLRRFNAVVAVSGPLGQRLTASGVPRDRVTVIPNGYLPPKELLTREQARQHLGIPAEALVAGWVGRLSHEKGPDLMLEALRLAPAWRGAFIGTGPLRPVLIQQAERQSTASRVDWHGALPAAAAYFRAFDAIVVSSRTEGTPIVVLEGMGAGVPLIAAEVGGIPDMLTGAEALVVSPGSAERIAEALQEVGARPEAARQRALAARARLEADYSLDSMLDRYETLYQGLAA